MRNLITCPYCLREGKTRHIGELMPNGYIKIMRFKKNWDNTEYTVLAGNEFTLFCGECNEPVFMRRKEEYEGGSNRVIGIYRIFASGSFTTSFTQNDTFAQGTAL